MGKLFDNSLEALSKSLDGYLLRHDVISDNIANAETPGFKARRVEFENSLQRALSNEDSGVAPAGLDSVRPTIYTDPYSEEGHDLNTVDMDREMAALNKNDVKYSASTQAVSRKFALLRYAISEVSDK
jgi:flagellar basal-body rod protein FlgB